MGKKGDAKPARAKKGKKELETDEIREFIIGIDSGTQDALRSLTTQLQISPHLELVEALGTTFTGLGTSLLKSIYCLKDSMVVPFPEENIGEGPAEHEYTYIKYMDWSKPRRQRPHPIPKCNEVFYLVWQEDYETALPAFTGVTVAQRISETIAAGRKWCDFFCSDPDCLQPITSIVFQGWGTNPVPNSTLISIVVSIVFKVECVAGDS